MHGEPVTVVTPYAGEPEPWLMETVASVYDAGAAEVIVVCDGAYCSIPSQGTMTVHTIPKGGIAAALNAGRALAKHRLIGWMSTGDLAAPGRYRGLSMGDTPQFGWWRNVEGKECRPEPNWPGRLRTDNQFSLGTMVVPASVWDAVGGFNEGLRYCVDWDFAIRVQAHHGWQERKEVLGLCRELPGGHTRAANTVERIGCRLKCRELAREMLKR